MSMKKEIIICAIIIAGIITGDIFLQKYTNKSLNNINEKLTSIKKDITDTDNFDMNKIQEIDDNWESNLNYLSCYLEHDELEKVETQLVIIYSGMETEDKEFVLEEIDRAIYIIDHIETKQLLRLDNIL